MKNKITQITVGLDSDNIICISILRTKPNGDTFGRLYYPELDTLAFVEKTFNTMLENDKIKVTHVSTITWKFCLAVTYVPVETVHSLEDVQVVCGTCGLPKLSGYWLSVTEEYRKCSDCLMAEIKQKENQK